MKDINFTQTQHLVHLPAAVPSVSPLTWPNTHHNATHNTPLHSTKHHPTTMTVRSSTSLLHIQLPHSKNQHCPSLSSPTLTFPDELQLTIPPSPSPHQCRWGGLHRRCLFLLLVGDHRWRGLAFQSAGVHVLWGQGVCTASIHHLIVVRISTSVNGNGNGNRSLT